MLSAETGEFLSTELFATHYSRFTPYVRMLYAISYTLFHLMIYTRSPRGEAEGLASSSEQAKRASRDTRGESEIATEPHANPVDCSRRRRRLCYFGAPGFLI